MKILVDDFDRCQYVLSDTKNHSIKGLDYLTEDQYSLATNNGVLDVDRS